MSYEADQLYLSSVESLNEILNRKEIGNWLQALAAKYDFKTVAYFASNIPQLSQETPYLAVTYSDECVGHYKRQNYESIDPVLAKGFTSLLPIDWSLFDLHGKKYRTCLLYTSDAADDLLCVDLGGRRIIK